jgi:hypothetical protein
MKKFFFLTLIVCLIALPLYSSQSNIAYPKKWTTDRNSVITVDINPEKAEFEVGKTYQYTITITALNFGSEVNRLHNLTAVLSAGLALYDSSYNVSSQNTSNMYELSNRGSILVINLTMKIPDLKLSFGESLSEPFLYKVEFKEGIGLVNDPTFSTGWVYFDRAIMVDNSDTPLFILGVGIVIIIAISAIILVIRSVSKKVNLPLPPSSSTSEKPLIVSNFKSLILLFFFHKKSRTNCPRCGKPIESHLGKYCSACNIDPE